MRKNTNIYNLLKYDTHDFENLLNINSIPYIETFTNHHSNRYEPTHYKDLVLLFEHLHSEINEDSYLVDFGSGLMRVPIFFNYYFDASALGIEMNKQLYLMSLENIKAYHYLKHTEMKIEAKNINAINYQFSGHETHLFFFNPFSVFVFQKIISSLLHSDVVTCTIILYYVQPEYEAYLDDMNNFKLRDTLHLPAIENNPLEKINIYEYHK